MQRLLVWMFTAALALVPVGLVGGPAQADDTYVPSVPTSCTIDAPNVVKVGQRVRLVIEVSSNTGGPITGSVDLAISTAGSPRAARAARQAKGVVWTRTVRYEGSPVRVLGPKLPRGSYGVDMAFTPDGGELVGCRDSAAFRVGASGDAGDGDNGSGGLPNTGGPHLYLLVLGLSLVGGGGVLVSEARRRRTTIRTA